MLRREEYKGRRVRRRVGRGRGRRIERGGKRVGGGESVESEEKLGAYECGFEPYDDARRQFNVHFYRVAIMFRVFDLEVCYRYPWVVSRGEDEGVGYRTRREFRVELVIGYGYVWRRGAREWE